MDEEGGTQDHKHEDRGLRTRFDRCELRATSADVSGRIFFTKRDVRCLCGYLQRLIGKQRSRKEEFFSGVNFCAGDAPLELHFTHSRHR